MAECAPPGRLFASIATLADTSIEAARAFEQASLAELRNETAKATGHFERGSKLANRLKEAIGAETRNDVATPLPAFLRHR